MEVGSRGFETHGVNKETDKIFNPELKDVMAPPSGQIPAGESITTSPPSAGLTDVQGKDKTLGGPTGTDTGAAPVAVFSFPPLTRDLNSVPSETDFPSYEAVGIEQDSQDEIQQIGEQEDGFDDMVVILEDGMVTSASLSGGGGPGDAMEQFQVSDSHLMESQHAPVPHTLPHTSVALEAPVEVNVNSKVDISLSIAAQNPIEENVDSVTQISLNVVSEVPAQEPSAASVLESSGFAVVEALDELPLTQEKDVEAVPPAVEPNGGQPLVVDEPGEAVAGHLPTSDVAEAEPVPEVMDITADSDLPAPEGDHVQNHDSVGGSNEVTEQDIQSIKGQKVTKKFGKKNFVGDVVDYDPESKWFKIVYEDGDEEDLELWEVKLILSSSHSVPLSSKKRPHIEEGDDGDSQKSTKKRKKSGTVSTVKKKKGGAKSSDKSPRAPGSQAKGSKKSSVTKKAKSPGKSTKKAFDSPSFKTPGDSKVKGGKGKGKSGTSTPKSSKGVSSKKKMTGKVLNLQSPKTQKKGKAKTTAESSGSTKDVKSLSKSAKIEDTPKQPTSVAKRKAEGEGTAEVKTKRPKKGITEAGSSGKVGIDTFIGKHVKKNFGGRLYGGVVVKLDKKTQYYKVKYEDGDQEDLEVHELEPILVREVGSTGDMEEKPAKLSSLSTLMSQERGGIQSVKKKK